MFNFNEILFYSFTYLLKLIVAKYFLDFYPDLITFLSNNLIRAKKKRIISKSKKGNGFNGCRNISFLISRLDILNI